MRTNASVSVLALIAIHAQKLKALWKIMLYEPSINSLVSIVRIPLHMTIIVNVVNSEEKRLIFSTASASITKSSKNNSLLSLIAYFHVR